MSSYDKYIKELVDLSNKDINEDELFKLLIDNKEYHDMVKYIVDSKKYTNNIEFINFLIDFYDLNEKTDTIEEDDDNIALDSYNQYFRSVRYISVLTREEEQVLFKTISDNKLKLEKIEEAKNRLKYTGSLSEEDKKKIKKILRKEKKLKEEHDYLIKERNSNNNEVINIHEKITGVNKALEEINELRKRLKYNKKLTDSEINKYKKLVSEEDSVRKIYMEARNKAVEHNLKLVCHFAKFYRNKGEPLGDLIQEGNVGLMIAIDKFDYKLGIKFSSYASFWIRQKILRYFQVNGRTIRLPVYLHAKISSVLSCERKLTDKLGRTPYDEEVANELGISLDDLSKLRMYNQQIVSINKKVGEEEDEELQSFIEDENSDVENSVVNKFACKEILDALNSSTLNERERFIILHRYGFVDGVPYKLEEIGKMLGVTRERVRQIEDNAILKLVRDLKYDDFRKDGYVVDDDKFVNIFDLIPGYSKEKIYAAMAHLSMQNYWIIINLFGSDLAKKINYGVVCRPSVKRAVDILKEDVKKYRYTSYKDIYEYFSDYPRDLVDEVITSLSDEDLYALYLRFNSNHIMSLMDTKKFDSIAIRMVKKMKKRL